MQLRMLAFPTLQMLDTCVRNCHPLLHSMLATSLLWSDMVKLVQDTSVSRIDDEVKMPCLHLLVLIPWFAALQCAGAGALVTTLGCAYCCPSKTVPATQSTCIAAQFGCPLLCACTWSLL